MGLKKQLDDKIGETSKGNMQAFGDSDNRALGVDKKGVAVWRLADNLDKSSFRHWIEAVDVQLEHIHK